MRRALFTTIVVLVVLVGLMPATAASAGAARRVRYYEGTTSEGGRLSISVTVRHDVPYLRFVVIDGPYSCEDGTQGDIAGGGFGWAPGPVIANEPFELSENWGAFAFMLSGRLGPLRGSGTVTFLMPTLTADEQSAQVCTFGGTWSVERSDTSLSLKPAMRIEAEGGRTVAMGFAVAGSKDSTTPAQTETGPIRHYRGRTAQDRAMALRTSRTNTRIALLYMKLGFSLACEDGTDFEGAVFPHAYLDSTRVMPPGRLDLDIPPAPDWFPVGRIALHVHGELDAHLGSGTLSMIWPWLTEDLRAQRCQTGDQTWRLWRTDAGF